MYVAKCVNKDYMDRKLGKRIDKWEKIVVGFLLMVLILLLLVGPIILFSALNPISVVDQITGGALTVTMSVANITSGTNQTIELFTTSSVV